MPTYFIFLAVALPLLAPARDGGRSRAGTSSGRALEG
jgi:hypothetical protein